MMQIISAFKKINYPILSIQLLMLATWTLTGPSKLFVGGVPSWFNESFGSTFLAFFPGLLLSYYSIAILETLAAILALVSLLRLEFLSKQSMKFINYSLILSLFLFLQLGFGKRLVGDNPAAASLFFYFSGTLICLLYVTYLENQQVRK